MRVGRLAPVAIAALAVGCLDVPPPASGDGPTGGAGADGGPDISTLMDGLIGWYQMDEAQAGVGGGLAPDATAHADGTCADPRCPGLTPGHIGGAYQFDGIDDEIVVPDRAELHSEEGTIAVWVYMTDNGTMFMTKAHGSGEDNSWLLYAPGNGSVLFETMGNFTWANGGVLDFEVWTHLAMTWSADGNSLYIDGRFEIADGAGTTFDDHPVVLGADYDSGTQKLPMKGMLDDARIYDRVLSADEIAALAAI